LKRKEAELDSKKENLLLNCILSQVKKEETEPDYESTELQIWKSSHP